MLRLFSAADRRQSGGAGEDRKKVGELGYLTVLHNALNTARASI